MIITFTYDLAHDIMFVYLITFWFRCFIWLLKKVMLASYLKCLIVPSECLVLLRFIVNTSLMLLRVLKPHFVHTQQTRNHFWASWHVSYWFIIGTTPVHVFMCIHMNTCVLPVVTSFERVWHSFAGTCHHVKNSWFHGKHMLTHQICS